LGEHEVALEVKATDNVASHHLNGLKAFTEEYKTKQALVVSLDPRPRLIDNITILPWQEFLERLWHGEIL
jgi:hypothetical protein